MDTRAEAINEVDSTLAKFSVISRNDVTELADLELALIGGGIGDTVLVKP